MSDVQTFAGRVLPQQAADRPALKREEISALSGIVIGMMISLPLWAAILAGGDVVLRLFFDV